MISGFSFVFIIIVIFGGMGAIMLAQVVNAEKEQNDEFDYSNEYDDVRPHLIYPDEPRLDKRIGQAAKEFGQNMKSAWESMVDSLRNYFDELKNLFNSSDVNGNDYGYGNENGYGYGYGYNGYGYNGYENGYENEYGNNVNNH